jgi:hypothetical protein
MEEEMLASASAMPRMSACTPIPDPMDNGPLPMCASLGICGFRIRTACRCTMPSKKKKKKKKKKHHSQQRHTHVYDQCL